jgi:hypothetical protein
MLWVKNKKAATKPLRTKVEIAPMTQVDVFCFCL